MPWILAVSDRRLLFSVGWKPKLRFRSAAWSLKMTQKDVRIASISLDQCTSHFGASHSSVLALQRSSAPTQDAPAGHCHRTAALHFGRCTSRGRWRALLGELRGLTFELSRERRCGAWPARPMISEAASRAKCHAGASRLERRVRPHFCYASKLGCRVGVHAHFGLCSAQSLFPSGSRT